jgi:glucokinase
MKMKKARSSQAKLEDMKKYVVGTVFEDSFLTSACVDLSTRKIVDKSLKKVKINPSGSAHELLGSLSSAIKDGAQCLEETDELKVSLGILGPCDYEEGLFKGNDPERLGSFNNMNLKQELALALGISPSSVLMVNDSVCFLRGEVFGGAVRYYNKSIGITLGAGLGSAIFSNGSVVDANYYQFPFKSGIAEEFLSVTWLVNRFYEITGLKADSILQMKSYPEEVAIQQVFNEFAQNLSDFLVEIAEVEKPDAIVIGGHMQASNKLFLEQAISGMRSKDCEVPVLRTVLGEMATVVGAASIWSH